jgi:hypothetical protein
VSTHAPTAPGEPPWEALEALVATALCDHPEALERVRAAFAIYRRNREKTFREEL